MCKLLCRRRQMDMGWSAFYQSNTTLYTFIPLCHAINSPKSFLIKYNKYSLLVITTHPWDMHNACDPRPVHVYSAYNGWRKNGDILITGQLFQKYWSTCCCSYWVQKYIIKYFSRVNLSNWRYQTICDFPFANGLLYNWLIWRVLKLAFSFQKSIFPVFILASGAVRTTPSSCRHIFMRSLIWR